MQARTRSMPRQIPISDKNYERLGKYARPFETPDDTLGRLLDMADGGIPASPKPPMPPLPPSANSPASGASQWIPLSNLIEDRRLRSVRKQAPPTTMRFPGGEVRPIGEWTRVQQTVAQWCVDTGALTASRCPLVHIRATLVNAVRERKDGSRFGNPKQIGNSGLWIEGQYNAPDQVQAAVNILKALGIDPGSVEVR